MSTVVPQRRIYPKDVANPEDLNATVDVFHQELVGLNEHNISSAFLSQAERSDFDVSVAARLAHSYNATEAGINEVIGLNAEGAANAVVFGDVEKWHTVWEFSWGATEHTDIYAMANAQVGHPIQARWSAALPATKLDAFENYDAMNIRLAWSLDGALPGEHVRGSMDLGATALNMERGPGGEFNAQEVSALFKSVPPGQHTMRLLVSRADISDGVQDARRRVNVPLWEALIWEIRR